MGEDVNAVLKEVGRQPGMDTEELSRKQIGGPLDWPKKEKLVIRLVVNERGRHSIQNKGRIIIYWNRFRIPSNRLQNGWSRNICPINSAPRNS